MKKHIKFFFVLIAPFLLPSEVFGQLNLVLGKNETYIIKPTIPEQIFDSIIMNDGSSIVFDKNLGNAKLTALNFVAKGRCYIVGNHYNWKDFIPGNNKARNGEDIHLDGFDGASGMNGIDPVLPRTITLALGITSVDQLIIDVQGVEGMSGYTGENGGDGYHANCDHKAGHGGNGGRGGAGGRGGNSTKLILQYTKKGDVPLYTENNISYRDLRYNFGQWPKGLFDMTDPVLKEMNYTYYVENNSIIHNAKERTVDVDSLNRFDVLYYKYFVTDSIAYSPAFIAFQVAPFYCGDTCVVKEILTSMDSAIKANGGIRIFTDGGGRKKIQFPAFKVPVNSFGWIYLRLFSPPPIEMFVKEERLGIFIFNAGGPGGAAGIGGYGGRGGDGIECYINLLGHKKVIKSYDPGGLGVNGSHGSRGAQGKSNSPVIELVPSISIK